MRITQPGTDIDIEIYVLLNDKRCDENIQIGRPISNNDPTPVKECCVIINEEDPITVSGFFTGTIHQARFDLYVDGAFAGDRVIEARKPGQEPKLHHRRKIDFKLVNSMIGAGVAGRVVEAEMVAVPLDNKVDISLLVGNGDAYGVGSLVIVGSVEQEVTPGYLPIPEENGECRIGAWRDQTHNIRDSGTLPTHCIQLRNAADLVTQRANTVRRHHVNPRPGYKPFAKLIFNYRSKESLAKASTHPAPMRTYPVGTEEVYEEPLRSPPRGPEPRSKRAAALQVYVPPRKLLDGASLQPSFDDLVDRLMGEAEDFQSRGQALRNNKQIDPVIKKEPGTERVTLPVEGKD